MNRRELLLHEMGITLWQLSKPEVLQGVGNLHIPDHIYTLLITEQQQFSQNPLVEDLLRSANSIPHNFMVITTEKLARLDCQHKLLIFCDEACYSAYTHSPLAQQKHHCIVLPAGLHFTSEQKRQIWQQIQQFLLQQDEH